MKKNIRVIVIIVLAVIILTVTSIYAFGDNQTIFSSLGGFFSMAEDSRTDYIVAVYQGNTITRSELEYNQNINALSGEGNNYGSDIDVINRLITGMILVEEAEKQGLAATQAEIDDMIVTVKKSYEIPEGAQIIDEYCRGAGITLDEYFELVEEQAYDTITRQKLRNQFDKEYCEEHGIEYGSFSQEVYDQITSDYNDYRSNLLEQHKNDIVYYID